MAFKSMTQLAQQAQQPQVINPDIRIPALDIKLGGGSKSGGNFDNGEAADDGDYLARLVRISDAREELDPTYNKVISKSWFNFELVACTGGEDERTSEDNVGREAATKINVNGRGERAKLSELTLALVGRLPEDLEGAALADLIGFVCKITVRTTFDQNGNGRSWANSFKPLNDKQRAKWGKDFEPGAAQQEFEASIARGDGHVPPKNWSNKQQAQDKPQPQAGWPDKKAGAASAPAPAAAKKAANPFEADVDSEDIPF